MSPPQPLSAMVRVASGCKERFKPPYRFLCQRARFPYCETRQCRRPDVSCIDRVDRVPLETPFASRSEVPPRPVSGFAPLHIPLFRDRWIASTISSIGTWMQDTAGTWLMTTVTASPLLIALMQTAASLPVLALGLL